MKLSYTNYIFFILLQQGFMSCKKSEMQSGHLPSQIPAHIVIVILENHTFSEIINDTVEAPYINHLAFGKETALFEQSYALGHPSQPNYLQFFSGSAQGVTSDYRPDNSFTTPNLAYELIKHGFSFISYSEGLPKVGFDGDSSGRYVRKHNPVANWMGNLDNQIDSSINQPFINFPADYSLLPTVCYVIPDLDNDMHDSTIKMGDSWLQKNMSDYIQWAKIHNSLFILTFDEGNYNPDGDHILTLIAGEGVMHNIYANTINHYDLLKTLEDIYSLPNTANATNAKTIDFCWE